MALQVLRRAERPGFRFVRAKHVDPDMQSAAGADTGVFRVSTEVWVVEFNERQRGTVVRTPQGRDVPSHGRLWIEPASGRILMTEIVVESRDVRAQMTVSFQSEPLLGLLVPVEMRESYRSKTRSATRIETRARYGKFSEFSVK